MSLTAVLLTGFTDVVGTAGSTIGIRDYLNSRIDAETILADLVDRQFSDVVIRLRHFCERATPTGAREPQFNKDEFKQRLLLTTLSISRREELRTALLPILRECVYLPGSQATDEEVDPIYLSILDAAIRDMWKRVSRNADLAARALVEQNETIIAQTTDVLETLADSQEETRSATARIEAKIDGLTEFARYAQDTYQTIFNSLIDRAPPAEHRIDQEIYYNPFLQVRAEDFNHNYSRLARLFRRFPEWTSVESRTDNVFVEGGRGTGKSMILRRLSVQAAVSARRGHDSRATFRDLEDDYFGVYVKLTRGYYEQFSAKSPATDLLAQQELNIEIFDAFVDSLLWLQRANALPDIQSRTVELADALSSLFPRAPKARTLEDLHKIVVDYEQQQILAFVRDTAFNAAADYKGSAEQTVSFLRRLSGVFRTHLFPDREVRLFILLDEFETLTEWQQKAINTVMKMRLPDLTFKVAVRTQGRRSVDTFTAGDPIQQPRDYTTVELEYDVRSNEYIAFLGDIAETRLKEAGYAETSIQAYLQAYDAREEVSQAELDAELTRMWDAGNRGANTDRREFNQKYAGTAVYRLREKGNRSKLYFGFDQLALLSSGITSNFIELCKYAFYFALEDGLALGKNPRIPPHVQSAAVYAVSTRLFKNIDTNVPIVGPELQRLLIDLGTVVRARLLSHTSDTEANRLTVPDYEDNIHQEKFSHIADILNGAIVWSVVHFGSQIDAYQPRNRHSVRPVEFIINRIYCPALRISPKTRWRTQIRLADLAELVDPVRRQSALSRLVRAQGHEPPEGDGQGNLLGEKQ